MEDEKRLLAEFRRKLMIEAVTRAVIFGANVALFSECIIALFMRFVVKDFQLDYMVGIPVVLFALTFLAGVIIWRPTQKKTARRIDELGLRERVITMLQLKDDNSLIALKQREDTLHQLQQVRASDLRIQLNRKVIISGCAMLVLAVFLCAIPLSESVSASVDQVSADQLEVTDELIVQLREIIESSQVTDDEKSQLNVVVDDLDAGLSNSDTTLSRTAMISTASKRLTALQISMISSITGGLAEDSEELTEEQQTAVGYVEETIQAMQALMTQAISDLNSIANGEEPTTLAADEQETSESETSSEDESKSQEESQSEDASKSEQESQSDQQSEEQESKSGEMPSDDSESNGGSGEQESVAENIYDPDSTTTDTDGTSGTSSSGSGSVPYSNVYDTYFDQAMQSLTENGEITDDMRDLIEQYFLSLH